MLCGPHVWILNKSNGGHMLYICFLALNKYYTNFLIQILLNVVNNPTMVIYTVYLMYLLLIAILLANIELK